MSAKLIVFTVLLASYISAVQAHHVLGRPAYSLNEDSNTPPSMQIETQIGSYFVTYMVFPAFPKPNEPGRVNLYVSRMDNGESFHGEVTFSVRDDRLFGVDAEEIIGTQTIDDGVYRQGFLFKEEDNYIITARFESEGEPYIIDFPLQIGESSSMVPVGIAAGSIVLVLLSVNVVQRRKLMREKIRGNREDEAP